MMATMTLALQYANLAHTVASPAQPLPATACLAKLHTTEHYQYQVVYAQHIIMTTGKQHVQCAHQDVVTVVHILYALPAITHYVH
jgi:hypothetical protein